MKTKYFIYGFFSKTSALYVGQTTRQPSQRKKEHQSEYHCGSLTSKSLLLRRCTFRILEEVRVEGPTNQYNWNACFAAEKLARIKEQQWIEQLSPSENRIRASQFVLHLPPRYAENVRIQKFYAEAGYTINVVTEAKCS